MNIILHVENEEDIQYLQTLSEEKKDPVMKTALSIGLKSIQMSEVNMDCHSYIDPIREIVSLATSENTDKIQDIDDKLDALLHIRTNSSRKGRLAEDLCIGRLIQRYPEWEFSDVTQVGHEGDCRAKTPHGEILYEFKSYDTNVNRDQLKKFYKDLETTGLKLGVFVSNTSGIVGKKNLEWEILGGDTLVIYISNTGFNGHGCIVATELLLALLNNGILDSENYWLLHQNYETDEIYRNLVDTLDDYRRDNESLIKLKKHVKEHRQKVNNLIDALESEVFQLTLNTEQTFSKMLGLVEQIKSKDEILDDFDFETFLEGISLSDKFKDLFRQLHKIIQGLSIDIRLQNDEWILIREGKIVATTKTMKTKLQLIIIEYPTDTFILNPKYEEFRDKKIILALTDDFRLWEIIQNRLS
tara:strand:+ start:89 stop:1330 length:1242 start_codon:yes stop_codon:yes gene_type:complete